MDADEVAEAPIHSINSGPAMAPVAGPLLRAARRRRRDRRRRRHRRHQLRRQPRPRAAASRWTRETWLGERFRGHMTGFPVGRREEHRRRRRLDRLGRRRRPAPRRPAERRRRPGPGLLRPRRHAADRHRRLRSCSGYIDPDFFLGGAMRARRRGRAPARSSATSASRSGSTHRGGGGRDPGARDRADGQAIEEITVNQGIDPRSAVLVGGGGAAGLNASRSPAGSAARTS